MMTRGRSLLHARSASIIPVRTGAPSILRRQSIMRHASSGRTRARETTGRARAQAGGHARVAGPIRAGIFARKQASSLSTEPGRTGLVYSGRAVKMTEEKRAYFRAYREAHKDELKQYHAEYWKKYGWRYNGRARARYYEQVQKSKQETRGEE